MKRRHALAFVMTTITLDMVAMGIVIPVLPKLILSFLHGNMVQAAQITGLFGALFALMQLGFSPVLGILSDRYGRKPVIVLSNLGLGLDYVIMALAPALGWLFAGRLIAGITSSSITTVYAYITDVTEPERRAAAFGLVSAGFGVGFIVGPLLGGVFGAVDPRLPFWIAAALSTLNGLYGIFVLPESLAPQQRATRFDWKRANPLGSLRMLRSHPELSQLSIINFVGYVAHEVLPTIWVLYVIYRYDWNMKAVGASLALVGILAIVVNGVLAGRIVAWLGERATLVWGLAFGVAGMLVFGWAPAGWIVTSGIVLISLWGLYGPPAQAMMTHRVGPSEQGELQGALGALRSITMIAGPPLFSSAYALGVLHHVPGAPWYLAAALLGFALLLAARITLAEPATARS